MFYGLQCTRLVLPSLNLFLSILYFILCDGIVNGIVLLISFFDCSLQVYENTTYFLILIYILQLFFLNILILCIYFWLRWVLAAVRVSLW